MLIMLDQSPSKVASYSKVYDYQFGQLRTPLTGYKWCERPYGIDNGCFTKFNKPAFFRLIEEARRNIPLPLFVSMPDIWGDAARTLEMFHQFKHDLGHLPKALVMQDGIHQFEIPWDEFQAIFIGGSNDFRSQESTRNICKAAKMRGVWVHVGRCNTAASVIQWAGIADSIDGSGVARYDYMLESVLRTVKELPPEQRVSIRHLLTAQPCGVCGASDTVPKKEKPSQGALL